MKYKKKKQYRLPNYDYSSNGHYFVTICVAGHKCLLGKIEDGKVLLSDIGDIVKKCWLEIPKHFNFVYLDEFVIMPNHLHGIVMINKSVEKNIISTTKNKIFSPTRANLPSAKDIGFSSTRRNTPSAKDIKFSSARANAPLAKDVKFSSTRRNGQLTVPTNKIPQPVPDSLSIVIRTFKGAVTAKSRKQKLAKNLWQPRFHDHIIRNQKSLEKIREYIQINPAKWNFDKINPQNILGFNLKN